MVIRTNYDSFIDSIDLETVEKILATDLDTEDKQKLIAYTIARHFEGVEIYMPSKIHKTDYAEILMKQNFKDEDIMHLADVSYSFIYSRRRKQNDR